MIAIIGRIEVTIWWRRFCYAHRDFHRLNGHGFDDSTHFKGDDKGHYKSGYSEGFDDAANSKKLPMCWKIAIVLQWITNTESKE